MQATHPTEFTARYVVFIPNGDSYQVAGFSDDKDEALEIYWSEVVAGHLWQRLLLLPKTWKGHYSILRKRHGRLRSAWCAWRLAKLVLR